jgi:SAM-dependent methyltransferase
VIIIAKLIYDLEYTLTFHSPGIEPWITGLLKKFKPDSVLDIGCGLGFWGLILKGYLGISKVVGVDIDPTKVEFVKRLNLYDELYVSDIRSFNYHESFDVVIAVESIHGILDENLLERLEGFVKRGGLIILALPLMSKSLAISNMIKRGYVVYRYFLMRISPS